MDIVSLSRLQFGITAMYHFIFIPLTLGLSILLVIMEVVYVTTGRTVWRDMVKFWGVLFGINFVMGVATGLTMEFQFGTNWAYYAHYVGDIFGAPLAIEGMMAFFLEATFVGLFFFGWDRLSKLQHLIVTGLVALGTNLSALWILIANGWMQNPVGARFDMATMSMQVTNFTAVLMNPTAQDKFVHTVAAGYVVGSMFMLSISAMYLLMGKHRAVALRSMTVAASFGLAASLAVVTLGDTSGDTLVHTQPMKMAAIEGMWTTEPAPAAFNAIGFPDQANHVTHDAIKIPFALGLIATHSIDQTVPGIIPLVQQNRARIESGVLAYGAMEQLRDQPGNPAALAMFQAHEADLGYGLLLKSIDANVTDATPAQITAAAWSTVPPVAAVFWSFRLMVGLGFYFIVLFAFLFYRASTRRLDTSRWLLWVTALSLPLPWVAAEAGWAVAEVGRQPWTIQGVLPTALSVSSLPALNVGLSLIAFILAYSALLVVEMFLMVRTIRQGPADDEIRGEIHPARLTHVITLPPPAVQPAE
jgi:cytochrome d ubiquinol oxidase subunit I